MIRTNEALSAYSHIGKVVYCEPYGNGHINDTFLTVTDKKRYILQRINSRVFPHPELIMENISAVTSHIRARCDDERCTLTVITTDSGDSFHRDSTGDVWRLYAFVEGTVTKERCDNADDFESVGQAFGKFQQMLSDFPAEVLHESIADFHNTPKRVQKLLDAVKSDPMGRVSEVAKEIDFVLKRQKFADTLEMAHKLGNLPLRVTHNDTKLNNILFDARDSSPVCVIDLDTVMPGYSVNDFGDSIRYGASTAAEDETDLSVVGLDLKLFESYARGFICGCGGRLTDTETELLPIGAMMMTFECGVRFLTDYIEGDVYFKIHRPRHNLDRCRNQFALLCDMEKKLEEMKKIIVDLGR